MCPINMYTQKFFSWKGGCFKDKMNGSCIIFSRCKLVILFQLLDVISKGIAKLM